MFDLTPAHWFKKRDSSMKEARLLRAFLTLPERNCPPDTVKTAVDFWVKRARDFHNIAMGRRPLIQKMVVINNSGVVSGPLYVGKDAA